MKNETVRKTMSSGQTLDLGAALLKAIPKDLDRDTAQRWIGAKGELHELLAKHLSSPPKISHAEFSKDYIPEKCNGYSGMRDHMHDLKMGDFAFMIDAPDAFAKLPLLVLNPEFNFPNAKSIDDHLGYKRNSESWGRFVSTNYGHILNLNNWEVMFVIASKPKITNPNHKNWVSETLGLDHFRDWLGVKKAPTEEEITAEEVYMYALLLKWGPELALQAFPKCQKLLKS